MPPFTRNDGANSPKRNAWIDIEYAGGILIPILQNVKWQHEDR